MQSEPVAQSRSQYISPVQLLISLTVAGLILGGLVFAGASGHSAAIAILTGSAALTICRILKRLFMGYFVLEQQKLVLKSNIDLDIGKGVVKVFDIYFAMLLVSGFCYGLGLTTKLVMSVV